MFKKFTAFILAAIVMMIFSVSAFAAGNDLIYIKRPESCYASTSDRTYTISAVGAAGTNITVSQYDSATNSYKVIKSQTQIGASGLYSVVVDLNNNSNLFRVYASNGSGEQTVDITINKIKKSTVDRLKGITVTIKNFFG